MALANLLDKVAYQLGLGSLADVGGAERVHAPPLRLAASDQRADACDLVEWMFREAWPKRLRTSVPVASPMSSIRAVAARSGTVSRSQTMIDCSDIILSVLLTGGGGLCAHLKPRGHSSVSD